MAVKAIHELKAAYRPTLSAFSRTLAREAHVLAVHPNLLWQQMYNRLQWEGDPVVEHLKPELEERSRPGTRPWLKCNTPFRESQNLLRTIQTPTFETISCVFSPEGDSILAGDEDGVIRIFQTSSGKQIHTIEVKKKVKAYHFSPDGQTIKTICEDGLLQAWETASGRQIFTSNALPDIEVSSFSQDGRFLLTHHKDKALILWNAVTGEYLSVLAHDAEYVQACSFSPNGRLIATTGGLDNQLRVWSAITGEQLYCSDKRYKHSRYTCNFSPDGQLIVTDSAIWEAKTGQLVHMLWGHNDVVSCCVFSPDGRFIASTSWDQTVRIWSVETGQLFGIFTGHTDWAMTCSFSPDGRKVLSASNDKTLRIWNIPDESLPNGEEEHPGGVMSCGFSPDGKLIAAGFGHGELLLIDSATGESLQALDITSNPVTSCAFSPDSRYIACAGKDWDLEVWDTKTCKETITFELDSDTKTLDCDISPDGKYLVASDPKGFEILIWDFVSKEKDILRKFEVHKIVVNTCKFSPDGLWIASGDWDSNLLIWDVTTGNVLHKLIGQTGSVNCCSFSPDGKQIVSGNENGSMQIWAVDSGDRIRSIPAHAKFVSGCAFSPDGSLIVSSGEDTFLKVYDANSFDLLAQFPFSGQLISLGLHPFEPKLVCGDHNGTLYKVELMGIVYQPIFVTPIYHKSHLLVRCPACKQEYQVDKLQLGMILRCQSPDCRLQLMINRFILGAPLEDDQDIATSEDIDWLRSQVRIYQDNNELERALEADERILELRKYDPDANIIRMSILLQLGRYVEVIKIGDYCIQANIVDRENPGKVFLLMGLAYSANDNFGAQRYNAALQWLEKSLKLQETSQAWLQHGVALANMGRPELALKSYLKARTLQSTSEKYQIDLAVGFTFLQMEQAPVAELEFRNTLADGNKDPLAYFGLGLALVLSGKADQSVQFFKSFLQHAGPEHRDYVAQAKLILDKLGEL